MKEDLRAAISPGEVEVGGRGRERFDLSEGGRVVEVVEEEGPAFGTVLWSDSVRFQADRM